MLIWAVIILENTNRPETLNFEGTVLGQYLATFLLHFSERNSTLFKGNKTRFNQANGRETLPEIR